MSADVSDRRDNSELLSDREWAPPEPKRRGLLSEGSLDISAGAAPVALRFGDARFVFNPRPPQWAWETIERICALGSLQNNWDSYGARPIDPYCARAAIEMVLSVCGPDIPAPAVVPTNRGGVQLEWHRRGVDLEIEVQSSSRCHVEFEDQQTGEEHEQTLIADFQPLVPLLQRISTND